MKRHCLRPLLTMVLVAAAVHAGAQQTVQVQDSTRTVVTEKRVLRDVEPLSGGILPGAELRTLFINKDITTFIVSGEDITLIDISTTARKVAGNQPAPNIARVKATREADNGADMGVLTVVGERSITQFSMVYVTNPEVATTRYNIGEADGVSYLNPGVDMPKHDMYMYCWRIINSGRKFYDVSAGGYGMKIRLNNIYSIGGYFFLDFSLENSTNIRFDIEEIRVKLSDKRRVKATNSQDIELEPALNFNPERRFKRDWRNILVLPKMTFPDEKVLTVTVNEEQISGRSVTLTIDYQDVLAADGYNHRMDR